MDRGLWRGDILGGWDDHVKIQSLEKRLHRASGGCSSSARAAKSHLYQSTVEKEPLGMDTSTVGRAHSVPLLGGFSSNTQQPPRMGHIFFNSLDLQGSSTFPPEDWNHVQLEPRMSLPSQQLTDADAVRLEPRMKDEGDAALPDLQESLDCRTKRQRKLGFGDSISKKKPGPKPLEESPQKGGGSEDPKVQVAAGQRQDELVHGAEVVQEKAHVIVAEMEKLDKEYDELQEAIEETERDKEQHDNEVQVIGKDLEHLEEPIKIDLTDVELSSDKGSGVNSGVQEGQGLSASRGTSCKSDFLQSLCIEQLCIVEEEAVDGPARDVNGESDLHPSIAEPVVSMDQSTGRSPLPQSGQLLETTSVVSDPELSTTEQHVGQVAVSFARLFQDERCDGIVKSNLQTVQVTHEKVNKMMPPGARPSDQEFPTLSSMDARQKSIVAGVMLKWRSCRERHEANLVEEYSGHVEEFKRLMEPGAGVWFVLTSLSTPFKSFRQLLSPVCYWQMHLCQAILLPSMLFRNFAASMVLLLLRRFVLLLLHGCLFPVCTLSMGLRKSGV